MKPLTECPWSSESLWQYFNPAGIPLNPILEDSVKNRRFLLYIDIDKLTLDKYVLQTFIFFRSSHIKALLFVSAVNKPRSVSIYA